MVFWALISPYKTRYWKPTFIRVHEKFCDVRKSLVVANISHHEQVLFVWLYHNNLCLDKAWWQTLVVANQFIGSNCEIKLSRIKIGFKYYWWYMNYTHVLTELHGWKLPLVRWLHTLCACVLPAAVHVFCALSGQEPADEKNKNHNCCNVFKWYF